MKERWLKASLRNLEEISKYISRENSAAAREVIQRILSAVERLEEYPLMGKAHPFVKEIREVPLPQLPYVIRYRLREPWIEIIRIHHSAQRWPTP